MTHLDDLRKSCARRTPGLQVAATVKVILKEMNRPMPSVSVLLYSRDTMGEDDLLGRSHTNSSGVARFLFPATRIRASVGDGSTSPLAPGKWMLPDLYSVVVDSDDRPVVKTRHQSIRDARRAHMQVSVPFDVALRHRLVAYKPGQSVTQKRTHWHDTWKSILDKQRPGTKPPVDFCFLRVILDVMSGLDAPDNHLRKEASRVLNGRASPDQLREVARLGREGVAMVDRLGVDLKSCSSNLDPEKIAEMLLRDGGPLQNIGQNLLFHAPPPDIQLPQPRAGEAFMVPWAEWFKDCLDDYNRTEEHGEPWPHDPQALEDMQRYFFDQLQIMAPPSVNKVEAYDSICQDYVRLADTNTRRMTVVDYNPRYGRRELDLDMHVPLTDSSCLYKHADPNSLDPGEYQALIIDVKPGQTVVFKGSGFISLQAEVQAQFARWKPETFDADGRLVPQSFGPAPALQGRLLDVVGSMISHDGFTPQTYEGDWVLLEWPDTEPGLYKLTLEFANTQGLATAAQQDPETCNLTIDSYRDVTTQVLWFAVVPEKRPRQVRMRATRLTCVDEKDPESLIINLFDNIHLQASAFYTQYAWNNGEIVATDSLRSDRSDTHEFWQDGDTWNVSMNVLPDDGTFHTLGLDEVCHATLIAAEVFGDYDRELLKIVIIAVVAIVITIFLVALVAAIIALVLIPEIALPVEVAVALLGGGSLIALLAGFLFNQFFKEIVAAVTAMLSSITGVDVVAMGEPVIDGSELAERLSLLRVHKLFPLPNTETSTTQGPLAIASELVTEGNEIKYTYTCSNTQVNSIYRLHVSIQPA